MASTNEEKAELRAGTKQNVFSPARYQSRLTLLLLLNTLSIGGIGFFFYQHHRQMLARPSVGDIVKAELDGRGLAASGEKEEVSGEGILFPLDNFTANLAQGDGVRRFARLNIVLKFNKNSSEKELKLRKPQMRDTIISMLNSKKPEDLLKREGKEYLKEEIKASINSFLMDGAVVDIYYVGFQIN